MVYSPWKGRRHVRALGSGKKLKHQVRAGFSWAGARAVLKNCWLPWTGEAS